MGNDPKTVYMLGAGASRASDFRLPTMQGFFDIDDSSFPEDLRTFLSWFYPDVNPRNYNLEEVLSFLNLKDSHLPNWMAERRHARSRDDGYTYDELLDYVLARLQIDEINGCSKHIKLFENMRDNDTVITTNYDLVIDQSLIRIENEGNDEKPGQHTRMGRLGPLLGTPNFWGGVPPALLKRERQNGFYLKLHGSLDWLQCPNQGCPNESRFFCRGVENLGKEVHVGLPCRVCGYPLRIFLVPPVATKRVDDGGRLAFIWNLALRELTSATRIVIIGLSFAPSDFELRWLIRQSTELRQEAVELHVVNPLREHREAAQPRFGRDCQLREFDSLEDYLVT